jgi:hypothetical protein
MPEEISRLLQSGADVIVREWTHKVASDRRVRSDAQLTYVQLVDHVPQLLEEVRRAIVHEPEALPAAVGEQHGRLRWKQGYELKEVVRELMLLRATLLEFIEQYRGALQHKKADHLMQAYRRINGFMDEELYRTIEAYLESAQAEQVTV